MDKNDILQLDSLRTLEKTIRRLGYDAIEGVEKGTPVVTASIRNMHFMVLLHNQCLKLIYRLHDQPEPGGGTFSNHWNTMNFAGTLIPMTDGYVMKHETLIADGIVLGNLDDILNTFAAAVDKCLTDWFTLITQK